MLQSLWGRFRQKLKALSIEYILPQDRSAEASYELLPTSTSPDPQVAMTRKSTFPHAGFLVLFLVPLLLIGVVSAGAYVARIHEVNDTLHAVTEINPDALAIASQLDDERVGGLTRGPLHGLPILIKNNIATNDSMNTTAGSWALVGAKVPRDATVAQKLRAAGAILLGKTNLSQWANFRSLNTSNGWSAYGGQSYGPYFPKEDPWGSSSGSGISSALGLALGCLGTETDGSIVDPADFNNIVGIKPTVGLTSRHLVIPISEHQDTVGTLARTVKDGAQILQIIAGVDPLDNYTSSIPGGSVPDFVAACQLSALSGVRLGIPSNVISILSTNTTEPIVDSFYEHWTFYEKQLPTIILEADFVVNLQQYLSSLIYNPNNITSLADLRRFTQSFPLEDYPDRDTGVWDAALQNWNNTSPQFWPAYQQNLFYGDDGGLLGTLKSYNLDAVILPTHFSSSFAATVGAPIVSVPMGFYPIGSPVSKNSWNLIEAAPNIPFGLSFLGARFDDAKLIGMAYAYEQRTHVRDKVSPYIVPETEIGDVLWT
ncbi:putative amidase [Fonsecaea erecta]|uniref:Putative amidase n=1 Tax=Fonsecaea erecta TaxID=1367422 RepID=A0A178ZF98_9EURO|nr:putative amidase [Fonsecaea erecta]OAP58457.1 putative amidase [Fonsecaea erecta]